MAVGAIQSGDRIVQPTLWSDVAERWKRIVNAWRPAFFGESIQDKFLIACRNLELLDER